MRPSITSFTAMKRVTADSIPTSGSGPWAERHSFWDSAVDDTLSKPNRSHGDENKASRCTDTRPTTAGTDMAMFSVMTKACSVLKMCTVDILRRMDQICQCDLADSRRGPTAISSRTYCNVA